MTDIGNKEVMAKNIAYYLTASGKSQKELAAILGVATSTVNDWLKAKKYPRIDKIEKMSDYFGILKSDLIEDKTKQPVENELSETKRALIDLVENLSEGEAAVLLASLKSGLGR